MASLPFPDAASRLALDHAGNPAPLRRYTVYADASLTPVTIYADNAGAPGAAITGSTVTTDANGYLPYPFWGPSSGAARLYVTDGTLPTPWPIDADNSVRIGAVAAAAAQRAANLADLADAAASRTNIGLGNVDNTSDAAKPVSAAQAAAIAAVTAGGALALNVKDQGAVGDGSTDDTAAFQAAITASAPGARVFVPPGTYIVSATLLPKAGTTLCGVRGKSVIKAKDGVTGFNVFQVGSTQNTNVVFEDLVIDLNKANTTNPGGNTVGLGIYIAVTSGGSGLAVRRVEVKNGWQVGLRFLGHTGQTNPASLTASEVVFDQCDVHDCNQQGIMAVNTTNLRITNCLTRTNGSDGIFHSMSRNTVISQCTSESNAGHGIVATYVESCKITTNSCRSNTAGWGIAAGGGSTTNQPNQQYVISGNTVDANSLGGITNDPTVTGSAVVQEGRMIVSNNISFNNVANHGIYLHNVRDAVVTGNVCFGNPSAGLALHGAYYSVTGNIAFSNAYGINFQGTGAEDVLGHHRLGANLLYNNTTNLNIPGIVADVGIVDPTTLRMASSSTLGFNGATPVAVQTVTGTRAGNTALTSMLSALSTFGLIVDSTTAGTSATVTAPDLQTFPSSGTWTKPANAVLVHVILIGPGGSGGSGRKGATGTVRTGGGGGGGGGLSSKMFDASDLTTTVSVTIGATGTPGAAQTTNSTDGNAATSGTNTSFGSYLLAQVGGRGFQGLVTAGTGGTGGGGTTGGMSGGSSTTSVAGTPATNNSGGGGGGGSGGTIPASNTATNGAAGGAAQSVVTGAGVGGVVDSTTPTSGTASTVKGDPSPGAGGGAASNTTDAQAGANGTGYGSGAGGGGAATDGVGNSGAGGTGGPGYALVITLFQ